MAKPTNTTNTNVLDIDLKGYRQTLQNKGKPRILIEGLSNAFDTKSTVVVVTFSQKDGWADLVIKDNDPDGFANLRDAYTLFAASNRREDPEARGRFGQGEKELVAIAVDGGMLNLASTKGSVLFTKEGRSESSTRTPSGTVLDTRLKLNQAEAREFECLVRSIVVPADMVFTFNGEVIDRPEPVKTVRDTLPTVIWDAEGNLVDTRRQTGIEIFEADDEAWILELGIPVVQHDGRFHINVGQKVPLNSARDNVKPAYLRKLREIMLDATYDLLTSVDQKSAWVTEALTNSSDEAFDSVMYGIYGKDAVIFDPSNPEASKRALDQGRTVIAGRALTADSWKRVRDRGVFKPAGQVIETHIKTSPDGVPPIERGKWTPAMLSLEGYVHAVGRHLLGFKPTVTYNVEKLGGKQFGAAWGDRSIQFNLRWLGKRWPGEASQEQVDALLLHEFSHHTVDDHLSDDMTDEVCRLGAKLRSCPARLEDHRAQWPVTLT